jgi:hypothetical protein
VLPELRCQAQELHRTAERDERKKALREKKQKKEEQVGTVIIACGPGSMLCDLFSSYSNSNIL